MTALPLPEPEPVQPPPRRQPRTKPARVLKFYDEPQPCRKCGEPCLTVKLGGRTPLHLACDHRDALRVLDLHQVAELVADIAEIFAVTPWGWPAGPLVINPPIPPPRPYEMGPCRRCQRQTRLYGDFGRPLCNECEEK